MSQKWYLDPDTFTEADPGDGTGTCFKIYVGPDDIGTTYVKCSVCGRQGQVAEGEDWQTPGEDIWISCSHTCRAIHEYELALQRKYEL